MSRTFRSKSKQFARSNRRHELTICVVDPQQGDYSAWCDEAQAGGVRIEFRADAAAALRLAREQQVDLWVINAHLVGLSGVELCTMLKSRAAAPVYLVANEYSAEVEQAAWQARATLFGVKPAHASWFGSWLGSQHVTGELFKENGRCVPRRCQS